MIQRWVKCVPMVLLATTLTGCLGAPELSGVQREIQRQLPGVEFEKEMSLGLGPLSLGLARFLTGIIPVEEADEAHDYLREVRRVQMAVYNVDAVPSLKDVRVPQTLDQLLNDEGWELVVKNQEDADLVWVLIREDERMVRDIYVVVLDPNELVLVRVQGRLDRLLAKAMENRADEIPVMLGLRDADTRLDEMLQEEAEDQNRQSDETRQGAR